MSFQWTPGWLPCCPRLNPLRMKRGQKLLQDAGTVRPISDRVFLYEGDGIKSIKTSFATACERAGIEDFRIHDMRHTFASHLVQNGVQLLAVKELLGHKTLAMVMRYAHLAPDNLRSAIEKLPGHNLGLVQSASKRDAVTIS